MRTRKEGSFGATHSKVMSKLATSSHTVGRWLLAAIIFNTGSLERRSAIRCRLLTHNTFQIFRYTRDAKLTVNKSANISSVNNSKHSRCSTP